MEMRLTIWYKISTGRAYIYDFNKFWSDQKYCMILKQIFS